MGITSVRPVGGVEPPSLQSPVVQVTPSGLILRVPPQHRIGPGGEAPWKDGGLGWGGPDLFWVPNESSSKSQPYVICLITESLSSV